MQLEDARVKLQKLQQAREAKLLEMRAFKLELEQKRAAMKQETAKMKETIFGQLRLDPWMAVIVDCRQQGWIGRPRVNWDIGLK